MARLAVLVGASPDITSSPVIPTTAGVVYNFVTQSLFDTIFQVVQGDLIKILEQDGTSITGGHSFYLRKFRVGTESPNSINVWIDTLTTVE